MYSTGPCLCRRAIRSPPSRQPLGAASEPVPSYHRPWLRVDAAFDAAGYEGSAQLVTMPDTPIDVSDNGVAEPTPAAPKPVARVPLSWQSTPL